MTLLQSTTSRSRSATSLTLAVTVATVLAGCLAEAPTSNPNPPTPLPPTPFVVSGPVSVPSPATRPAPTGPQESSASVWVSLPVGSLPDANGVTISVLRTGVQETVIVTDGGFDPVGVAAQVGDTLVLIVNDVVPGKPVRYVTVVPAISVPVVVRSSPPPHKRDVPLNAIMMFTFSEPMDSTSLVRAIGLSADTTAVVGTVQALVGGGAVFRAVFTPTATLAPLTSYVLRVGTAAEGVQGDSLRAPVAVDFTTAADTSVPPPDSSPKPPPPDPTPLLTILTPAAGDTVPVDYPHVRFMLKAGTYSEVDVLLEGADVGTNPSAVGGTELFGLSVDSTEPWNYWGDGYPHMPAGTYSLSVYAADVLGHQQSVTIQPLILAAPDTTPRILVRSFAVVEYQYPGDSASWYYAPQLVVSAAPRDTGLRIVGFDMLSVPGLTPPFPGLRSMPFGVPSDRDTPLFRELYGDYELAYSAPDGHRSTGGVATARLTYRDATNHYYAATIQGPITPGGLPTTYSGGCSRWMGGPPITRDPSMVTCPAALRRVAGGSSVMDVRSARPRTHPTRARQ